MRRVAIRATLAAILLACPCACQEASEAPAQAPSVEAGVDAPIETSTSQDHYVPPYDAGPVVRCTLDNGGDPVGLCVQKFVLQTQHEVGFAKATGTFASWDAVTFLPTMGDGGITEHSVRDDIRYGASLANYHRSAGIYGDTELTATFDADLVTLVELVASQMSPLPADLYDGEIYAGLRSMAAGLRRLNAQDEATKIDVIADAYGRSIAEKHLFHLAAEQDGGAADSGTNDAANDSDGAWQGGTGTVLGNLVGSDTIAYEPAKVASGAVALLDMAERHAIDSPAESVAWQVAAAGLIDHLWVRAREPSTGLLYTSMEVALSGGVDVPVAANGGAADLMLTDVQAAVALSLVRAQDLVSQAPDELHSVVAAPFQARADALVALMNGTQPLWDGDKQGYYEGVVGSTGTLLRDKPTRGNAWMLAVLHRTFRVSSTPYAEQINPLRKVVMERLELHSGLLSAMEGQVAYFMKVPSDYTLAGDGGAPRYVSASVFDALEGLEEQWYGLP